MPTTQLKTIGIREFREHLTKHVRADTPLAITRHGLTIGYYIPAQRPVSETDLQALEDATRRLHALLEARGIDPEDLLNDYTTLRKARRKARGEVARP
jgi:antitoxin (DNA-binding transcriptional repressor) of toxin-antitoxin stability system